MEGEGKKGKKIERENTGVQKSLAFFPGHMKSSSFVVPIELGLRQTSQAYMNMGVTIATTIISVCTTKP